MRTDEDYRDLLAQVITPPGRALSRDTTSTWVSLLWALGAEFARIDGEVVSLADELDPRTTLELLPEWEAMVGLPDDCAGTLTLDGRRNALVQRLTARGNLSKTFLIEAAAALGFTVTIVEFDPVAIDEPVIDEPFIEADAQFYFEVQTADLLEVLPLVDAIGADEPFGYLGNAALMCLIDRVKPAHTVYALVTP
jgi:uncharacterized protein YmfQ (DUF2313 family)